MENRHRSILLQVRRLRKRFDDKLGFQELIKRILGSPHQGHTRLFRFVPLLLFGLIIPSIPSAQSIKPIGSTKTSVIESAPVVIDGVTLFRLPGIPSYPANIRAHAVEDRIIAIARDKAIAPESLHVIDEDTEIARIMAKDQFVLGITHADAQFEGVARHAVLKIYTAIISDTLKNYRESRSRTAIIRNSIFAAAALTILAVLMISQTWAFRRIGIILERRYKRKISGLQIKSFQLLEADELWKGIQGGIKVGQFLLTIALIYTCLNFILGLYPWTRGISNKALALLLDPLSTIAEALINFLPNFIFLSILFFITRYLLKLLRLFFAAVERGRVHISDFEREWAWPTYRILRLVVVAFVVVIAYPYIPGSESAAFKGITILLGVMFSLGSSSIIANVVAGYTMTYRRAFRLGDRIRVGDIVGDVVEMRVLETHLRSLKNEEIVIPNNVLLNSHVVNYTSLAKERGLILHTTVGIGYDVPWRQVEAMLLLAAERTPGLLGEPAPFVLEKGLGDFCVRYELNVYCERAREMSQLYAALHQNILDVFNEYEVTIMTPAYVSDTADPKVVRRDFWFRSPAKQPPSPPSDCVAKEKGD